MVDDLAFSVRTATARAGVTALVVDARPVVWTLAVSHAFRTTSHVRIALVVLTHAIAHAIVRANGIQAARVRVAGVSLDRLNV